MPNPLSEITNKDTKKLSAASRGRKNTGYNVARPLTDGFGTNPSVLDPVPSLTIQGTILHEPALAANQSGVLLRFCFRSATILDTAIAAPLADTLKPTFAVVVKVNVTVDPITHVSQFNLACAVPATPFQIQDRGAILPPARETYHFTIFAARWIRATAGEVVKDFLCRNEGRMGEEDLGVRSGLVGEQDDKRWGVFS